MSEISRRRFITTLVAGSSVLIARRAFCADRCDTVNLSDVYRRRPNPTSLSISFLGTFAIFVNTDSIVAYAPDISNNGQRLHNYWLATPDAGKPEASDQLFDLSGDNKLTTITGSGSVPQFSVNPDLTNNIDKSVSIILPKMNAPTKFLHKIVLPLPNDVLLGIWARKIGSTQIFPKQTDFCWFAREHFFLYDATRFDVKNLRFNDQKIDPSAGLNLRFVSEPIDDNGMVQECITTRDHVQRAMQALATMLGQSSDAFKVNDRYCNVQVPAASFSGTARTLGLDGGGNGGSGAVMASRFPACGSVVVNNT